MSRCETSEGEGYRQRVPRCVKESERDCVRECRSESQHYTTSTVQQLTLFCIIQDLKCTRSQLGTWHQQKELAGG